MLAVILASCSEKKDAAEAKWDKILESAKETSVHIVGEFSDAELKWLKKELRPQLKSNYGISLSFESMRMEEVEKNLKKSADTEDVPGIDLIYLGSDSFSKFKAANLLYSSFAADLPNYAKFISDIDMANMYADITPIDSMAIAMGQNQLNFFYDDDVLFDPPESVEMLESFLKKNPGAFTYPNPKVEEGRRFVEAVILEFASDRELHKENLSEAEIRDLIRPGLDYLRSIKPYLYGGGNYYPFERKDYEDLFKDGRIKIIMSLNHRHGNEMVGEGLYPERTRSLKMLSSSPAKSNYLVIANNSENKSGALVTLNHILEPKVQNSLYNSDDFTSTLVYSEGKSEDVIAKIDEESRKKTVIKPSKLLEIKKAGIPDKYWNYIYTEWAKL